MIKRAVFLGHLGLGDHIICQGMVNKLAPLYDKFYIVSKSHNSDSVRHMCRHMDHISIIDVIDDNEARIATNLFDGDKIKVGLFGANWRFKQFGFDEAFYSQLGMDIEDSFSWMVQDGNCAETILRKLYPERDFCFVHDDPSRGYHINPQTDLPIVRNTIKSQTIFDYLLLLRQAKEIHCMDSSFSLMIDRSDINENLFIHRNVRKHGGVPTYQKKWKIV